jgi:NAD(P)H-quinone oxidoreductase subunit 5
VGWELLGLSSALLVGYFHERRAPVQNALRVFGVYRASDAAMLSAAVLLHHFSGSGELSHLFMRGAQTPVVLESAEAFTISVLIIIAVAGKSALWPFSGWLPRAMEGPTPSSAIYYGALSIHAGCYLLLRAEPLIGQSLAARGIVVFLGLTTALYAGITTRVQTDVKSALSFAALTQVGIIVIEIGLGLTTLALVHIAGHATFRLLQFLTAPNVLHDLHQLEQRVGASTASEEPRALDRWLGKTLYLVALERGFADSLVELAIVRPFCRVAASLDRLDRWLTGSSNLGSGGPS